MATMANLLLDKDILLESGTNELELLVFDVADYTFGINVAKVREVLPTTAITQLPRAHSSIRGVFKLRNRVIPCVSLIDHLGIVPTRETSEGTMILTDFNQQQTAFLVDEVERIHRLSWESILAVPGMDALSRTPVTALARCENRLIVMLDFEMILDDVTDQMFRTDAVDNPLGLPREQLKIVLAEDSPTVRDAIGETLRASGYTQLRFFENGGEAWQWIDQQIRATGCASDVADLIISDVEMPQIDGFHLTKRIKEHNELKKIPVLLYSSIITPDNFKKGQAVKADDQISKPELDQVVGKADNLIAAAQRDSRAEGLREVTEATTAPAQPVPPQPATPAPAPKAAAQPTATNDTPAAATETKAPTAAPAPPASPEPPKAQSSPEAPPAAAPPAAAETSAPPSAPAETASSPTGTEPDLISDDVPPPAGVRVNLWRTFRNELVDRAEELGHLLRQIAAEEPTDELLQRIARLLHTVKSAAMVIPLDPVTRVTHEAETVLQAAQADRARWSQSAMERYLGWLHTVIDPPGTVDDALAIHEQVLTSLATGA